LRCVQADPDIHVNNNKKKIKFNSIYSITKRKVHVVKLRHSFTKTGSSVEGVMIPYPD
jgi:hypothetical protein